MIHCHVLMGRLPNREPVLCARTLGHDGPHRIPAELREPVVHAHRPLPRDWYRRDGLNVADPVTATDGFGERL